MEKSTVLRKLGDAIRTAREQQGISQEELAFRCGLHRTYVGSIERSERNVALENIVKIAKALEIDAWQLLKRADL